MTFLDATPMFQLLGWVLVHSLWQFAAIALLAAVVDRLLRDQAPATRYAFLLAPLAGCLAAAVATGILVGRPDADANSSTKVSAEAAFPAGSIHSGEIDGTRLDTQPIADAEKLSIGAVSGSRVSEPRNVLLAVWSTSQRAIERAVQPWFGRLVTVWLLGVLVFALRPAFSLYTVHRLRTRGVAPVDSDVESSSARLAQRIGARRAVRVLQSAVLKTPVVVGWLRPTILLPASLLSGLPAMQVDAILAHELAHVRRHDYLVNLAQSVVETLFFYHPAVWWLSGRVRDVRELSCDDLAVAALGDRVVYGRALVAIEEHRGAIPGLALGARGGSVLERIERLFQVNRRSPASGLAGAVIAGGGLLCVGVFALGAWADTDGEAGSPVAANVEQARGNPEAAPAKPNPDEPAGKAKPKTARGIESLNIIIAENVIVWDREVVTWDEVVDRLRDARKKQGAPIHPNLYFTNGAHNKKLWDMYHDASMELYRELFEPAGISFGSISPRASPRYDEITEQADLDPNPELLREGVVRDPKGAPVVGATVVLFPENAIMPIVLDDDLSLRDTLDEVWTTTDREGRFRIESPDEGFRIAVISAAGFTLADVPVVGTLVEIELPPLARVDLAGVDGANQKVGVSIHVPGLPNDAAYFQMYDIELKGKSTALALPAGRITVSRSFPQGNGGSISIPAETFELPAGGRKSLKLPVKTQKEVLPEGFDFPGVNEN